MDEDAFDIRRHVKLLSNSGSMLSEDDVLDRMSELIQEKEVYDNFAKLCQFYTGI